MALKDWKRDGKDRWTKWLAGSKGITIYIYKPMYKEKGNYQLIRDNLDYNKLHNLGNIIKHFKTKSSALKFAKSYMRKH